VNRQEVKRYARRFRILTDGMGTDPLPGFDKLRIEQTSTAQRVTATMRDLIIRGELRPGQPLPESAVARSLGISRNTVREAFRLLTSEGLAVHSVNRTVSVKLLTPDDVRDIYAARRALELWAIRSHPTVTDAQRDALRAAVERGHRATEEEQWATVAAENLLFHQRIVELIGSDRIDAFFARVLAELALAFAVTRDESGFLDEYRDDNSRVLALLEARDWDACAQAMENYLDRSEKAVEVAVRESLTSPSNDLHLGRDMTSRTDRSGSASFPPTERARRRRNAPRTNT
jgi:DNA-binding GntR family transcriptional regulator